MPPRLGASVGAVSGSDDVGLIDDVVRRAQQGDVQAFESLYHTHAPAVYALCRRMIGDEPQARDLMQDAFVRAWERLTSFRGHSSLGTWIHRLAVNVVLEHLRSSKRDALRMIDDPEEAVFGGRTIDGQLDARMDIDTAMAQLPTGARTVFELHDRQGYSHDEIAQMMGIAPGTARAQLFRARRALTRLLDL